MGNILARSVGPALAAAVVVFHVTAAVVSGTASAEDLTTHYEKSGRKATPRYQETIDYCQRLARSSRWIHYRTFGTSPQGRDLPLLIADEDQAFEPDEVRRDRKVVLLIQAGIHSGEIDGKDAGFMLLRDIATRKGYSRLLDHVTILFIPIFNVDGHERFGPHNRINQNGPEEMGWRTTARNLNLNRDYLKADAPEMQAWIRLFNEWEPDFLVDCHVTDGADYQYALTYALELYGNTPPGVTRWMRDRYLPDVTRRMAESGIEIFPYVFLLDWGNPSAGMRTWVATPRYSTGYGALRSRPALLIETHMLKDYETRVTATYRMLEATIEFLNEDYRVLRSVVKEADRYVSSPEFRKEPFPLRFSPAPDTTRIAFKGIDCHVVESEISGGKWHRYNGRPVTMELPYLEAQSAAVSAKLPEAYIIPPEWRSVIERLALHGAKMTTLKQEMTIEVDSYRFENVTWDKEPYEGRHPARFDTHEIREARVFPVGSVVVPMSQPAAPVIAHILEPKGPDSYVSWGFFDTVFEQKEYAESYVMERMARDMLAEDDELRRAFDEWKKQEPELSKDPRAVLNWFYRRTPYWDDRKDVYPVGKIVDAAVVEKLLLP